MGYVLLLLALTAGLVKGFAGKSISRDTTSLADGLTVNVLRCVFSSLIAFGILMLNGGVLALRLAPMGLLVSLLSSVFMCMFCVAWLYAYRSEAYVFLSVFTMLGSVLTALLGFFVYGDEMKPTRIVGMLVLFAAVYVMSLYNTNLKGKMTVKGVITLLIGGVGVALSDFMQKVFTKEALGNVYAFNFYTYFLLIIPQLLLVLLLIKGKGIRLSEGLLDRRHILIFFVISVMLYLNSISKTLANAYLPATVMYPTLQAANLVVSAILARLLLKEKLTKKSILGIALALLAVVLMNT